MTQTKKSASAAARLAPAGQPAVQSDDAPNVQQPDAAAVAFRLAVMFASEPGSWIYLASSERRAEETSRALAGMLDGMDVLHLPAWDCLPYDRAPPSSEIMGKRMSVLRRLLKGESRHVLVLSPEAALQKLPPASAVGEVLELRVGQAFDREAFERFALRTGYTIDDRVDEPGEIAMRGNVVEVFAADLDEPVRITDTDGAVDAMRHYDPRTQRSLDDLELLVLGPASELVADPETRSAGAEHRLASFYGALTTVFDYLPDARLVAADLVQQRLEQLHEQINEAYATARDLGDQSPAPVGDLYLEPSEWAALAADRTTPAPDVSGLDRVPAFSNERNPGRSLQAFIAKGSDTVVLCGTAVERKRLRSMLTRNGLEANELDGPILGVVGQKGVWFADLDIDAGFHDPERKLSVIAAADVLGSRLGNWSSDEARLVAPTELRVGDVVVHEDHGVGVLHDLTRVLVDGQEQDTINLRYHGDVTLMVPVADFGKLWRYGAEEAAVTLDRLNTDAWTKKRASVSLEITEAAEALAALARERLEQEAVVLKPAKGEADRLAARFPYPETPDQTAAIQAVLADLTSGHAMNRLICGDVGFGKTEVALRAATAAALCGAQVAVVAPTTVLASQHLQSFQRRFEGTDIIVGMLSRLNTAAESATVKEQLRSGELRIVVATHAIAADDVQFEKLGLVIIDEEQRFGAKLKRAVEKLAEGAHLLSMSATPIPRSLQAAMVGLQDVSILATPPSRRRPIRTFLAPFDLATVRTALLREKRRGGQSFVVVPRIGDIDEIKASLAEIVPELTVAVAHGELSPKAIDATLLDFANGQGDVLLATSIIESGLDVPRANTMLVTRADRFGLAQLHQLRGRVGRGRTQGVAYLFTDPAEELSEATRARLSTLEAFDRLGSGFDISARDLELRGAGELLGDEQAGHLHLIGSGLYQQLLERALAEVKGETDAGIVPAELNVGRSGSIPVDYVPEAAVRINLYARLQRLTHIEDVDAFGEELEDRFGPLPAETSTLLALGRLALRAGALGVSRVDAGPLGIALTPRRGVDVEGVVTKLVGTPKSTGERIVFARAEGADVLDELTALFGAP